MIPVEATNSKTFGYCPPASGNRPTLVRLNPWMAGPHAAAVRASIASHDPQAAVTLHKLDTVADELLAVDGDTVSGREGSHMSSGADDNWADDGWGDDSWRDDVDATSTPPVDEPAVADEAGDVDPEPRDVVETPHSDDAAADQPDGDKPESYYSSVNEFVREYLISTYRRSINGRTRVWAARWWEYPEAIIRLEAPWRAWEDLRLEPTVGMSVWLREHADHHMPILMDPDGPFAGADPDDTTGNTSTERDTP